MLAVGLYVCIFVYYKGFVEFRSPKSRFLRNLTEIQTVVFGFLEQLSWRNDDLSVVLQWPLTQTRCLFCARRVRIAERLCL